MSNTSSLRPFIQWLTCINTLLVIGAFLLWITQPCTYSMLNGVYMVDSDYPNNTRKDEELDQNFVPKHKAKDKHRAKKKN